MAALHDEPIINFEDVNDKLDGTDFGQLVFDTCTRQLPAFDIHSMQVFTGIGYVFTQAKDVLPFIMVDGPYHERYNRDPPNGPKIKMYLGKYLLEEYFATKEFIKYPPCKHVVICDWNKHSIQMILDILKAAPRAFEGQTITVVHGDILNASTLDVIRGISDTQRTPISAVYVTNIVNNFTPELIDLFRPISASDVVLICDTMDMSHTQLQFHTRASSAAKIKLTEASDQTAPYIATSARQNGMPNADSTSKVYVSPSARTYRKSSKSRSKSRGKSSGNSRSRSRDKIGGFTKRYRR